MEDMDVLDVVRWLRHKGLKAAAKAVGVQDINGNCLLALLNEKRGLAAIGVNDALDRARVHGGIADLDDLAVEQTNSLSDGRDTKRPRLSVSDFREDEVNGVLGVCSARDKRGTISLGGAAAAAASAPAVVDSTPLLFDDDTQGGNGTVFYAAKPLDYLQCAICWREVMVEPYIIKGACVHSFCHECLLRTLRRKNECPKCKATPMDPMRLLPQHRVEESLTPLVHRNTDMCTLVGQQLVHCPSGVMKIDGVWCVDPGGCPTIVPLAELERHIEQCNALALTIALRAGLT